MDFIVTKKDGAAIQEAIDMANAAGGGRVVLEPGDYECVTLFLKSHVELNIPAGSRIMASPESSDYPDFNPPGLENVRPENSQKCVIACAGAEDVSITGLGEINGRGPAFYDHTTTLYGVFWGRRPIPRPRLLQFYDCKNVCVEGVTLRDSAGWTCWMTHCEDVRFSRMRIIGDRHMINNDGVDIDSCNRVTVTDSFFDTGDDCIAIRAVRRSPEDNAVCENVLVSNCHLCSSCQCVRVGCPNDDTIRNLVFHGLVMHGRGNGILCQAPLCYLRKGESGLMDVHNVQFSDCDIDCPWGAISILVDHGIRLRGISDFAFRNMQIKSNGAITLKGNVNSVLENICLENIRGTIRANEAIVAKYVRNLVMNNVALTAEVGEPEPFPESTAKGWEAN